MANFINIPLSLFCCKIAEKLSTKDICNLELTCKQFKRYLSENFWKRYFSQNFVLRKKRKTSKERFAKHFDMCKTSTRNSIIAKYKQMSPDCYNDGFQNYIWNFEIGKASMCNILFDLTVSTNRDFQKQKLFKEIKYPSSLLNENEKTSLFLKIFEDKSQEKDECIKKIMFLFPKHCETQFSLKFKGKGQDFESFHVRFSLFARNISPDVFSLILETYPKIGTMICNFVDKFSYNILLDIIGTAKKECPEKCGCMKFINVVEKFMGKKWILQKLKIWKEYTFIRYCDKHVRLNFSAIHEFANRYDKSIEYILQNSKWETVSYNGVPRASALFYGCIQSKIMKN